MRNISNAEKDIAERQEVITQLTTQEAALLIEYEEVLAQNSGQENRIYNLFREMSLKHDDMVAARNELIQSVQILLSSIQEHMQSEQNNMQQLESALVI